MDSHRTISVQSQDNQWTVTGQSVESHRTISVQSQDNQWTDMGQLVESHRTISGQPRSLYFAVFMKHTQKSEFMQCIDTKCTYFKFFI